MRVAVEGANRFDGGRRSSVEQREPSDQGELLRGGFRRAMLHVSCVKAERRLGEDDGDKHDTKNIKK
jgi:hypothetical protein